MNRKTWFKLIISLCSFLFIFTAFSHIGQSVPPVTEETLIVDITGNGEYTSIQEAIKYANVTDTILIRKGVYFENNLDITKKIVILGEDPSNTIINCLENIALILNSSFVDISNLQIINTGEFAIIIESGSTDCSISNCIINTNYKGVAIDIRSSYNIVSDCSLIGFENSKQGIKIQGSYNIIKNCDMQNFANGVLALIKSNNNQILNCNILNNENAIDFRLTSNKNTITSCNIYSNLQGIKISNSNNNLIYLNNFWNNDLDVIDEGNNSWDNGSYGNYWLRYRGVDANGDGIGDVPYIISEGIEDRYPLINMILPDIIISPTSVKHISSKSDSTPAFTWAPSQYRNGIRGYYVKIDNGPELFIGNITSWTSAEIVSDGIHTFYVRSEGIDNKLSNYSSITFSIDTTFIDSDNDGWSDQEEQLYGSDPNNPYNYPLDTDGDHKPNSIDIDDDNDGYSDEMENSYNTNSIDKNDYPVDSDNDGIPDESSTDGKYSGDDDDDNDGLTDSIEALIGSNPKDGSDATRIFIAGKLYFLVDLSKNDLYDILYEPASNTISGVEKIDENYLIDINKDGLWDFIYRTNDGSISKYKDESELTLPFGLIIILILIPIVIFYYLRKKSIKYKKPKEQEKIFKKPLVEPPIKLPIREKKETVDMISETKALLQYIQKDVEIYMEKLREIEGQFIETEEIQEEIVTIEKEQEPAKPEEQQKIENKVDKILDSKKGRYENKKQEIKESLKETEETLNKRLEPVEEDTNMLYELKKTELEIDKIFDFRREEIKEKEYIQDIKIIIEKEQEPTIDDELQNTENKVDKILDAKKGNFKEKEKSKTVEEEEKKVIKNINRKVDKIIDSKKDEDEEQD